MFSVSRNNCGLLRMWLISGFEFISCIQHANIEFIEFKKAESGNDSALMLIPREMWFPTLRKKVIFETQGAKAWKNSMNWEGGWKDLELKSLLKKVSQGAWHSLFPINIPGISEYHGLLVAGKEEMRTTCCIAGFDCMRLRRASGFWARLDITCLCKAAVGSASPPPYRQTRPLIFTGLKIFDAQCFCYWQRLNWNKPALLPAYSIMQIRAWSIMKEWNLTWWRTSHSKIWFQELMCGWTTFQRLRFYWQVYGHTDFFCDDCPRRHSKIVGSKKSATNSASIKDKYSLRLTVGMLPPRGLGFAAGVGLAEDTGGDVLLELLHNDNEPSTWAS